jgi:large subunit ribosomal protein L7/L12
MDLQKLEKIANELSSLTVLEGVELSKLLEEKWGVSAAAAVVVSAGAATPAVEEQTEFDVLLIDSGANKLQVIKKIREFKSELSLTDAKTFVESASSSTPKAVKEGVSKDEAQKVKAALEAEGAKVEVK